MARTKVNQRLQDLLRGGVIATFLLMALGLSTAPAYSQFSCTASSSVSVWNLGATGNWNVSTNWNPSGIPNSSSTTVCIVDGTSTVNLTNLSPTVDDLTLNSGNGLDISTGLSLEVAGTSISNAGTIDLNGGGGANGFLEIGNNVTLQGGGTVNMSVASGTGNAFIEENGSNLTLTNADNTIQGDGEIGNGGLAVSNAGTIDANVSGGTLQLNGGGNVTNTSLLEATNGGTLDINNTVTNTGGNITANGGTVQLDSATVQGGTLNTLNSGVMETTSSATLSGVTISTGSTYTASNSAVTYLEGTITNQGTIQLNGGGGADGYLEIGNNVTLQGGGTVNMSVASGTGSAFIEENGSNLTLTNADNTIQGDGVIGNGGLAVSNAGTIDANVSGGTLQLNGSGNVTNTSLLEATNGGTLDINNTVTNTGGNITANGGTVQLDGATVQGGTLNTLNSGVMETTSSATLDGSTAAGAVTISGGSTYTASNSAVTYLEGTITNQGTIQLNGGGDANGYLEIGNNVTLQGGGTVNMSVASGTGNAFIEENGSNLTLTNADNTIQGDGIIGNGGLAVSNAGTIDANVSGGTLQLNGGGNVTNTSLLEGTNGGTLDINNTVTNTGGNITANGGTVQLDSATVQGGTLNTTGGGLMETTSNSVLNGVTISSGSTYTNPTGQVTGLLGTITNNGTLQVNGGGGSDGYLEIDGDVTLEGGGTVNMSVASGTGSAYIEENGSNLTLTNADNTIQGDGTIGNGGLTVVNGGTLLANVSGQTLLVNGSGSLTNNGTFEAAAGSTLQTQNGTFTNFSGATLTGGTYDANGTIQIDQLGSTGGEIVTNDANIILDGSSSGAAAIVDSAGKNALVNSSAGMTTNNGSFTVENGGNADFTTAQNLTNTGTVNVGANTTLTIGPGGGNNYEQETNSTANTTVNGTLSAYIYSQGTGNTTINTGGVLNSIGAGYNQSAGTTTVNGTLNPGSNGASITGGTLYGTGTINGGTTIASAGTLQPGSASSTGTLNISGTLTLNGTLDEIVNSSASPGFDVTAVSGGLTLGSGSTLDIMTGAGFTPANGDVLDIMTAGSLVAGTFGTVDGADFTIGSNNWQWNVGYNNGGDNVTLTLEQIITGPTTVNADWTTGTPASWTTASNWACSPGASICVPSNGTPTNTVYDGNIDNTASGATMTLSTSETVDTLALTAGTLDIASGGSLNLADQPNGITDIPDGAGLSVEGSFTAGSNNALAGLTSVEGTLTLDNGQTTGVTPSDGTLTVSSTGSLNVSTASTVLAVNGGIANSGAVNAQDGGAITTSGNYAQTSGTTTISGGSLGAQGELSNDSASNLYVQNGGSVSAGSVDNFGSIITGNAPSDTGGNALTVAGAFTNESGATLSLMAGGDNVTANGAFTNSGAVSVASGTALFANDSYTQSGTSASTSVAGTLTVTGGYTQNEGNTTVESGGTLTATTAYSQSSGVTDVDGTLISPTVTISGGTLKGTGLIEGSSSGGEAVVSIMTGGTFQPSDPMAIDGTYSLDATDTFLEDITSATNFGALDIEGTPGTASIAGTLDIDLLDSFLPTNGEQFVILDATGGLTGTFSTIDGLDFGPGDADSWNICVNSSGCVDEVTLTADVPGPPTPAPEPGSLLLLGMAVLGLAVSIRRTGMRAAG